LALYQAANLCGFCMAVKRLGPIVALLFIVQLQYLVQSTYWR
jgi:hypothetical protein